MYYNLCDTHTHTLFSRHAYSTVEENVRSASEKGLELLSITEHFGNMICDKFDIKAFQHIYNMGIMFPKYWHGVRLIHGVEADIVDLDGHLFGHDIPVTTNIVEDIDKETTLFERITRGSAYIIASLHGKDFCRNESALANTKMYIKVIENPKVRILGHIGRSGIDMDIDAVLDCAKAHGTLIELNEHSFHFTKTEARKRCTYIAQKCARDGIGVTVASDAHIATAVGCFDGVFEMLKEIDFPQELIMTRDKGTFCRYMGIEE